MAAKSTNERVSVLETQVINLDEKVDEIKSDVKDLGVKMINHSETVQKQLKTMYDASCTQHAELANKIGDLEKFKNKWSYMILGGVAVGAWMIGHFNLLANILK